MTNTWPAHCRPARTNHPHTANFVRSKSNLRQAIRIALCLVIAGPALFAAGVPAALAAYAVDDPIINPLTGATEKVLVVGTEQPWVFTDQNHAIYVGATTSGTPIADPNDATKTLTIATVHEIGDPKRIDYAIATDGATPPNETRIDFVQTGDKSALPDEGDGGTAESDVDLPDMPTGNSGPPYRLLRQGGRGGDGSGGYGIRLWFFTIGVNPTNGGTGGTGSRLTPPVGTTNITTVTDAVPITVAGDQKYYVPFPGVWVQSRGGDGGKGGNSYTLGTDNPGGLGGAAGVGGYVDLTWNAAITTSGWLGHGIFAQSIAGLGGAGGSGYLFNSGAQGGSAAAGGFARATNLGTITTFGDGADGVLVQSLGGGGGIGGGSYGIVGTSGGGSRGGNGGTATGRNDGTITVMGDGAHGLVVQSIGGDGGDAGSAGGIVSFGGSGAAGGNGGTVYADNFVQRSITAGGDAAFGILAQSIGGGGGNGGTAGGIVGIGGSGAGGGSGGLVTVTNAGSIATNAQGSDGNDATATGVGSHGIVAQSIGGGGGTGGTGAGIVGLGGSSTGTANYGQQVTVTNAATGSVVTVGTGAYGILAQSIGGGGGAGGTGAGVVGIGAKSGGGGAGGKVVVDNDGTIVTHGSDAKGIVAQSIGGGGGSAHGSGGLVSIGGQGGSGGAAGVVEVSNAGWILTGSKDAKGSDGILAQSIGGGGGTGGSSGGLVALGGAGTAGGLAGTVTVTNTGLIDTLGGMARGVHAQSIGGGGGSGGDSGGLVSLGGTGSVGSAGNLVTIVNDGTITTDGRMSSAIEAQSIGGGGGSGGTSGGAMLTIGGNGAGGGDAGLVTLTNEGVLETLGADSHGILAQSIGGGGGNGGNSASASAFVGVGIGGSGAGGGAGKLVTIQSNERMIDLGGVPTALDPYIHTTGDRSKGILAQSVGGGGGNGGFAIQATVGYVAGVSVAIGGQGGVGGDGGEVKVLGDTQILTEGVDADGIVAQSVGGGGGNGGFAVSFAAAAGETVGVSVGVGVAGAGGSGGVGNTVTLDGGGDIHTRNMLAEGIVAQSVGGSGGNGGFSVAVSAAGGGTAAGAVAVGVGGVGGAGGNAGKVDATWLGDVTTEGTDATAIVLQAVGGSGGNGGFNVSASVAGAGSASGAVAVGVGGSGGGAGTGGKVIVDIDGDITTTMARSGGLLAQSVGGSGGNGGFNVSGSIAGSGAGSGAVSVGVGGSGGDGGGADTVTGEYAGHAQTQGDDADAIVFQSVGGGGGNGAFNVAGNIAASTKGSGGVSVGVGGSGGGAGAGNTVTAASAGMIETTGARSNAFVAQSLGGGGGNGGFNVSGGITASAGVGGAVSVGVGGAGGDGGGGGLVDADVAGTVITRGADATAIIMQSIGGGGGTGGLNVAGSVTATKSGSGSVAVGVGGSGGGGGAGGEVLGYVDANVTTAGDRATGVLLQSVGGGGGSGGINVSGSVRASKELGGSVAVGVGGSGDVGGEAKLVTGTVLGTVTTTGDDATGVIAQSIGGGGGNGGLNVSGSLDLSADSGAAASIGIGGFGAGGGKGGEVFLTRTGATQTDGTNADGIVVQSVGGGGGSGGINVSGAVSASSTKDAISLSFGLGGFGGGGGAADDVTAHVTGNVLALGLERVTQVVEDGVTRTQRENGSNGIVVQSIGGSGGNGATNVSGGMSLTGGGSGKGMGLNFGVGGFAGEGGDAGEVLLTVNAAQVTAMGDERSGVIAQSIGGGGGNGGANVSGGATTNGQITLGVGGFGGKGGLGQKVDATVNSNVTATGEGAIGFLAQSIGGRGGNGGFNISGGIRASGSTSASSLVFGLGGFGGEGNRSGEVIANQSGAITVTGAGGIGVLAQSIAGGGGNGGLNVSGNLNSGKGYTVAIGVGGSGGKGANAQAVTLTSDGAIVVDGGMAAPAGADLKPEERAALDFLERANGILAQSIGGGGGNGGANLTGVLAPKGSPVAIGVGGTGSGGGDAGKVTVLRGTNAASFIVTAGDSANGLTAQSIGGGGGNAGANLVLEGRLEGEGKQGGSEIMVAVGGGGGDPGHGNEVSVQHVGQIQTDGRNSDGILAQSIGGGGGNAAINLGFAYAQGAKGLNVAVGGGPGEGGDGKLVTVDHAGTILTAGDDSSAIFAQSVGGGGGNVDENSITTFETSGSLDLSIGRKGGEGGLGGNVDVTSAGALQTGGNRAVGIFAQSVGNGGGKSGTFELGFEFESKGKEGKDEATDVAVEMQVGLEGGKGGEAGDVEVTASGSITTAGKEAHAIQAQSVGGGGGVGGGAGSKIAEDGFAFSLGVGGTGGTGALGGTVLVDNGATLVTAGAGAHGIFAQSIGGGGGVGGNSGATAFNLVGAASKSTSTTINLSVGGSGGIGADADTVTVTNSGSILTQGAKAYGINAQSTGGGGGQGGAVIDEVLTRGTNVRALTIDVGGLGGDSSDGQAVTVTNTGVLHTLGADSIGIRAQSLGGSGGDAGLILNLRADVIGAASSSTTALINIGTEGGKGGTGGTVTVTNARRADGTGGVVLTEGARAHGIFAQSLGGGGGNGSSIISANLTGGMSSTSIGINIGGKGGEGATGGAVSVANAGSIETLGADAHGVFAQSTGGGGGNGGLTLAVNAVIGSGTADKTPLVALGGAGGTGGNAGNVTVTNTGSIVTRGDRSHGIYAQTTGGGGGDAGISIGLTSGAMSTRIAGALSATLGGLGVAGVTGGEGGQAGTATVVQQGDIVVLGRNSRAVAVENINGGGGHVALDFSGITSFDPADLIPDLLKTSNASAQATSQAAPVIEFHVGGVGTRDSSAGRTALDYTGDFGVAGDDGVANSAQAVGGGGGTIDVNLGIVDNGTGSNQPFTLRSSLGGQQGLANLGGEIASRHDGDVLTEGANTLGVMLQSIGGGGGRANVAVNAAAGTLGAAEFSLGGMLGNDESGAAVTHQQLGSVATSGVAAHGVLLQSVGGGGGLLTYRVAGDATTASASGKPAVQPTASVRLGGVAGAGLDGASVALQLTGDTSTRADHASGIVLQSIGGGGGGATVIGVDSVDVTIGGMASASGDAGSVEFANRGNVSTTGAKAHGVFLQSIGGGGGAVFTDAGKVSVTTSASNAGDGGAIRYTQQGDVLTGGVDAYGLVAQSLGGGGGFVDGEFAGSAGGAGQGGNVVLDLQGNVAALGDGSVAVFVQSAGRDGAGDIDVTLGSGFAVVGGIDGIGVQFDGGAANSLANAGSVLTLSGVTGLALKGGAGDDSIANVGVVLGNVDLGTGLNRFDNEVGASLYAGATFNLGSTDGMLLQRGLFAPGANGEVVTTNLSGSFGQTATGIADFDLDFAADAVDSLSATGTVELDGTVQVAVLNVYAVKPGDHEKTLFQGAGGLVDHGLTLQAPESIVIGYQLLQPTANSSVLAYSVDFAPDGLLGNRREVGSYLNRVQAAGSAPILGDTIESLVAQTELAPYSLLLTQLGPEFYAEQQALTLGSVQRFARVVSDCGATTSASGGDDCVWMRFDVDASNRDEAAGFPATYETARRLSLGRQKSGDNDWTYGLAAGFEHNNSAGFDGRWRGETTLFQAGFEGRKAYGATSIGGTLTLGNSGQSVRRQIDVTEPVVARGNRDVPFIAGVADVTHAFDLGAWRLAPALNLGVAHLRGEQMQEHGADGQELRLAGDDETSAWLEPAIDAGFTVNYTGDKVLRLYARFAALYYLTDPMTEVSAGLVAAPGDASMMQVGSDLDDLHWLAEGGFELIGGDRYTFSLSYGAQRSDLRDSDAGTVRVVIPLH